MSRIFGLSLLIQVLLIGFFLVFIWRADQVMDKSGIGNVQEWSHLNHLADNFINCLSAIWILTIFLISFSGSIRSKQAQLTIALPPLALIIGWLALFFI